LSHHPRIRVGLGLTEGLTCHHVCVSVLFGSTKFFDLSPEDEEEVKTVRLSLYNNVAQCYLKLQNWDAAIRNCNEALTVDADNAKALYRRAVGESPCMPIYLRLWCFRAA
jgi:hypothetical protein